MYGKNPHIHDQLVFQQRCQVNSIRNYCFSINNARTSVYPYLKPYTTIDLKQIIGAGAGLDPGASPTLGQAWKMGPQGQVSSLGPLGLALSLGPLDLAWHCGSWEPCLGQGGGLSLETVATGASLVPGFTGMGLVLGSVVKSGAHLTLLPL